MVYICDNCAFMFSQNEEPEQCPDCGKNLVRPANAVEQDEFAARRAEPIWDDAALPPFMADVVPEVAHTFKFQLPTSALDIDSSKLTELGISSDMPIAIMVEHDVNPNDPSAVRAGVWIKPEEASFSKRILLLDMPLIPDETPAMRAQRIYEGLIRIPLFWTTLRDFMVRLLEDQEYYI